jgi:hypothetical protein
MQRDDQGKLIAKETDEISPRVHVSGEESTFETFSLFAENGTGITAFKNLEKERREFDTNCHGYTFGDGEYWIQPDQVMDILRGDSYKRVDTPQEGDVIVWWDSKGDAVHSAKVVSVSQAAIEVEGISGIRDIEARRTTVENAWPNPATPQFYRKEVGIEE